MLALDLQTPVLVTSPIPAFGRGEIEPLSGVSPDLANEVWQLAPRAAPETALRLAEAISLRGAELVAALLDRFETVDEALAALEDYAGAFDSLADFAAEVLAERHPLALGREPRNAEAMGLAMIERGEVFALRLGADLHLFWSI